jgi:choline dehydrogenase-like flavoprotein
MAQLPWLARALVVLRDRTRGQITLGDDGAARVDYALVPEDRARLGQGMAAIARAFLAAGAREVILPVNGSDPVTSERDLAAREGAPIEPARTSLLYAVHLFGGACMGGDPERSVCDEAGHVRGVRGLHVSDASALPSNTGVNPQITILANAFRVTDAIAAERAAA